MAFYYGICENASCGWRGQKQEKKDDAREECQIHKEENKDSEEEHVTDVLDSSGKYA